MWVGDEKPYQGKHYQLARPLNVPSSSEAAPPILIGGAASAKRFRLVAQYGDACNLGCNGQGRSATQTRGLREHARP